MYVYGGVYLVSIDYIYTNHPPRYSFYPPWCGPPLSPCGPGRRGPCVPLWAGPFWAPLGLVGRALWAPWALVGWALVGPPALAGSPGPLWAGPLWAPLGPYGPGRIYVGTAPMEYPFPPVHLPEHRSNGTWPYVYIYVYTKKHYIC